MKVVSGLIDGSGLSSKRHEMDLVAETFESANEITFASAKGFRANAAGPLDP
jgi:hypothetical protein